MRLYNGLKGLIFVPLSFPTDWPSLWESEESKQQSEIITCKIMCIWQTDLGVLFSPDILIQLCLGDQNPAGMVIVSWKTRKNVCNRQEVEEWLVLGHQPDENTKRLTNLWVIKPASFQSIIRSILWFLRVSHTSNKQQSEWCESIKHCVRSSEVAPLFQTVLHCPPAERISHW